MSIVTNSQKYDIISKAFKDLEMGENPGIFKTMFVDYKYYKSTSKICGHIANQNANKFFYTKYTPPNNRKTLCLEYSSENIDVKIYNLDSYDVVYRTKFENKLSPSKRKFQDIRGVGILVERHPEWKWNMYELSYNPSITPDFVEKYPNHNPPPGWTRPKTDWKWDVFYLSRNISITPKFIEDHLHWKWDMNGLSQNPSITPAFIEKYPHWRWNPFELSSNPGITSVFVEKYPNGVPPSGWPRSSENWHWYMNGLAQNPSMYLFIIKHHTAFWNNRYLSLNPALTLKFIEKHIDWKWYMFELSGNSIITPDFVEKHPNGVQKGWLWDMDTLSGNPSFTPEIVEKYANWRWNPAWLSRNTSMTSEFVDKYPDFHPPSGWPGFKWEWMWNMRELSGNIIITPKFVEDHPTWNWDMIGLSENPSMTIKFIEQYPDGVPPSGWLGSKTEWKWDMNGLSKNTFKNNERTLNCNEKMCFLISFIRANKKNPYQASILPIIQNMRI